MKSRSDGLWLSALVSEIRTIRRQTFGHSFKRRHSYIKGHRRFNFVVGK